MFTPRNTVSCLLHLLSLILVVSRLQPISVDPSCETKPYSTAGSQSSGPYSREEMHNNRSLLLIPCYTCPRITSGSRRLESTMEAEYCSRIRPLSDALAQEEVREMGLKDFGNIFASPFSISTIQRPSAFDKTRIARCARRSYAILEHCMK